MDKAQENPTSTQNTNSGRRVLGWLRKKEKAPSAKSLQSTREHHRRTEPGTDERRTSTCVKVTPKGETKLRFTTLHEADFYHGFLSRRDAEQLLHAEGDFLVRTTTQNPDEHKEVAISVRWNRETHHIIPKKSRSGGLCLERHDFTDIAVLLKFHFNKREPLFSTLKILLLNPIPKPEWELSRNQIKINKELGKGAFGVVYSADLLDKTNKKMISKVAVKCYNGTMTKKHLTEFLDEARLMRNYDHPNVVKFLGVVIHSEPIMIVMELVPGGGLDALLQRRGDLIPLEDLLQFCLHAATGLQYLHDMKCIHRDIAARNCLIGYGVVKISDFGMCREACTDYKMDKKTKTRIPIRWLAPEVMRTAVFTFSADVFSFGVLMWEVFSNGAMPYPELDDDRLLCKKLRSKKEVYRMAHPKKMPPSVCNILDNCWHEDPKARPTFANIVVSLSKETATPQLDNHLLSIFF